MANVSDLIGKTLTGIDNTGDKLIFTCDDGTMYRMYHYQDCCESVSIDDIYGSLEDLIGLPILFAEEATSEVPGVGGYDESQTWTFYKFATANGWVDIRWYGTSNGYYSESVDFELIEDAK